MEGVSTAWSIEIQDPPESIYQNTNSAQENENGLAEDGTSAVTTFEQTIHDPKQGTAGANPNSNSTKIEIESTDLQDFFANQANILEDLKARDDKEHTTQQVPQLEMSPMADEGKVNEHIGPVQFNMGGIQVDADDMLKKLRVSTKKPGYLHLKPLLNSSTRIAKPFGPKRKRLQPRLLATTRRTIRLWQTSLLVLSRNPARVPGGALRLEPSFFFSLYFSSPIHSTEPRSLAFGNELSVRSIDGDGSLESSILEGQAGWLLCGSKVTLGVKGGPMAFRQVLDSDTNMKSDLLLHSIDLLEWVTSDNMDLKLYNFDTLRIGQLFQGYARPFELRLRSPVLPDSIGQNISHDRPVCQSTAVLILVQSAGLLFHQ